jgi:hypothetical protein
MYFKCTAISVWKACRLVDEQDLHDIGHRQLPDLRAPGTLFHSSRDEGGQECSMLAGKSRFKVINPHRREFAMINYFSARLIR